MPSSGNTAWFQTIGQLEESAALELGAISMGDSLEASEEAEMTKRLNAMLAKWSIEANLFRDEVATVTITGGTGTAILSTDVRDIRGVRHIQSATYKRPLMQWNRDDYFSLPNRAQAGATPLAYYLAKRNADSGPLLYIWPVPAANVDLELDYSRAFYFAEDPTQTLDLPAEWHEAALYGLAARCAGIFGATKVDPASVQRIDAQARSEYERLLDSDRPDSYRFEYDSPVEAR